MAVIFGVPKETKTHEYRIGMTPVGIDELVRRGHRVLVETGAGAVGRTSTCVLTNATLPYTLRPADLGCKEACQQDSLPAEGINIERGKVTNKPVADTFGLEFIPSSVAIQR